MVLSVYLSLLTPQRQHESLAQTQRCDRDVMWVAVPMQSALSFSFFSFFAPPLPPLLRPTAAHHTLTSGHPLQGLRGEGRGAHREPCTQVGEGSTEGEDRRNRRLKGEGCPRSVNLYGPTSSERGDSVSTRARRAGAAALST